MGREEGGSSEWHTGTERVLAFSDGVFAIAITLLVLDLLPSLGPDQSKMSLWQALSSRGPAYISYILSFLIIGIIWTNHHQMFTQIKRANHLFLLFNVVFLMWVAVLPFPAALLAQYLTAAPGQRRAVVALYAGTFVVGALLFNLLWWYGVHNKRLTGDDTNHEVVRRTTWSYYVGPVAYLCDVGLALVSAEAGLALFLALAVFYALAPLPGVGRLGAFRPPYAREIPSPTVEGREEP